MIVRIDANSSVPPFEQVRSHLAKQINNHELVVGTKLPTVRGLALELGIAPNTIARAYRELEEAGLIETRGRAGSFVGSSGDKSREQARNAALNYAKTTHELGLDKEEALAIVSASFASIFLPRTPVDASARTSRSDKT